MSKVVRIHEQGAPDVLRIEDLDVGAPGRARCACASRPSGSIDLKRRFAPDSIP